MAKPVKPITAIYLDEDLNFLRAEKKPTVVRFPDDGNFQDMKMWVQNENGDFEERYRTPAEGGYGFPLFMNNPQNTYNGFFLDVGDICKLEFVWDNRFTGEFVIPKNSGTVIRN